MMKGCLLTRTSFCFFKKKTTTRVEESWLDAAAFAQDRHYDGQLAFRSDKSHVSRKRNFILTAEDLAQEYETQKRIVKRKRQVALKEKRGKAILLIQNHKLVCEAIWRQVLKRRAAAVNARLRFIHRKDLHLFVTGEGIVAAKIQRSSRKCKIGKTAMNDFWRAINPNHVNMNDEKARVKRVKDGHFDDLK